MTGFNPVPDDEFNDMFVTSYTPSFGPQWYDQLTLLTRAPLFHSADITVSLNNRTYTGQTIATATPRTALVSDNGNELHIYGYDGKTLIAALQVVQ